MVQKTFSMDRDISSYVMVFEEWISSDVCKQTCDEIECKNATQSLVSLAGIFLSDGLEFESFLHLFFLQLYVTP